MSTNTVCVTKQLNTKEAPIIVLDKPSYVLTELVWVGLIVNWPLPLDVRQPLYKTVCRIYAQAEKCIRVSLVTARNMDRLCVSRVQVPFLVIAYTYLMVFNGCNIVEGNSGSGTSRYTDLEGSGGSEMNSGSGNPDCKAPSITASPPVIQEDELLTEIQCHLACIQWVSSDVTNPSAY